MNAGAQSSLLWTVFDQLWPNHHGTNADSFVEGDQRCGVMPNLKRTLVPRKSYYAFSMISRYVTAFGTRVYEGFGNNGLNATMSVSKEGDITVVVVNCKETPDEFTINFENAINTDLNRHSFDPAVCVPDENAEIIGTDKVFKNVETKLEDTIAPYGVKVYTTLKD